MLKIEWKKRKVFFKKRALQLSYSVFSFVTQYNLLQLKNGRSQMKVPKAIEILQVTLRSLYVSKQHWVRGKGETSYLWIYSWVSYIFVEDCRVDCFLHYWSLPCIFIRNPYFLSHNKSHIFIWLWWWGILSHLTLKLGSWI